MIIVRSPLRITLGGGGTDLPSYYRQRGGFLISAAINRYVYVSVHERHMEGMLLRYSKIETPETIDDIKHPIIRECLKFMNVKIPRLEITSMADVHAGTGLGSSGSFTCALLRALKVLKCEISTPEELASQACHIEIDRLGEPVGKQDQYISAYGGVTCFEFNQDDSVKAYSLNTSTENLHALRERLVLFSTGTHRSASAILKEQDTKTKENDDSILRNLDFVKELGYQSLAALQAGDWRGFGEIMHTHWEHKKKRSNSMSSQDIDLWYEEGLKNSAVGGKVIGAGGGGFLMFVASDPMKLSEVMRKKFGLTQMHIDFVYEGTKVIS